MIIYRCRNKTSGKVYIGQSVRSLEERKHSHFNIHLRGKSKFYKALKSYGFDNFEWDIIDTAKTQDELNEKEIKHISEYNSIENGYNMVQGGAGGYNEYAVRANQTRRGKKYEEFMNPDHIDKMKSIHKKTYNRVNLARWNFKNLSDDERLKMAKRGNKARFMKGYKHSEETKRKIADAQRGITYVERYGESEAKELSAKISESTKEAMKNVDWDLLMEKALDSRKTYWDNKHTEDRNRILELKSNGISVKKICSELDISTPTYYKRLNELKEMGLI